MSYQTNTAKAAWMNAHMARPMRVILRSRAKVTAPWTQLVDLGVMSYRRYQALCRRAEKKLKLLSLADQQQGGLEGYCGLDANSRTPEALDAWVEAHRPKA